MKIEERERLGLWQFREKGDTPWRFYVNSFSGDGKTAYCREWGGGERPVPITRKGYLVVGGRRIGPRRWDH